MICVLRVSLTRKYRYFRSVVGKLHNGQAAYLCAGPDNVWPNTECADSLAKNCDQVRHDSEKCVACTRAHNGPPGKPLCKPKERNAFCNATSGLGNVAAAGNNTAPFSHGLLAHSLTSISQMPVRDALLVLSATVH